MAVDRHWYRSTHTLFTGLLLPLSWLFGLVVWIRRALYRFGLKKTHHFSIPVIVVGNITVGGTGKTPFVIWLANFLKTQGFRPGIVSRGYGGKFNTVAQCVAADSDPKQVGDEVVLLAKRTDCPVVVCAKRVSAVQKLMADSDCNVVISDDGLQHYSLGRNIEIAIVDGDRRFGNGCLLPAGPLREPITRLQEVDWVVAQQQAQRGEYAMVLQGETLVKLHDQAHTKLLHDFAGATVHAVAAVGNPARFFAMLRCAGMNVIEHVFPDHYAYQASDFYFGDTLPIVMTEKDAVKCFIFADERFWCLPVTAQIDDALSVALLKKLGEIICVPSQKH